MSELPVYLVLLALTDAILTAVGAGDIPITHPDPLLARLAAWRCEVETGPPLVPALPRNRAW